MPDFYRRDRGYPFTDYLTASEAAKILEDARADIHAEVEGGLEAEDGFAYYAGWHETAGAFIRTRVRPVPREHIPAAELARLEAQGGAHGGAVPGVGPEP